jgi:hypothetical protein
VSVGRTFFRARLAGTAQKSTTPAKRRYIGKVTKVSVSESHVSKLAVKLTVSSVWWYILRK